MPTFKTKTPIRYSPEIKNALEKGKPIVALESAVITHGLPAISNDGRISSVADHVTLPVAVALGMEAAIRESGAIPATIGIQENNIVMGLNKNELINLSSDPMRSKANPSNLARIITSGGRGGTTVGGTLIAIKSIIEIKYPLVMATGGIGGVHQNWTNRPDISADFLALATTPCLLVCAGAKSILDTVATIEILETLGIPTAGWRCDHWPQFIERNKGNEPKLNRIQEISEIIDLAISHWTFSKSAIILARPLEKIDAIDPIDMQEDDTIGSSRTPKLLNKLADKTKGASLNANIKLLTRNAALAGRCACQLP